MGKLKRVLVLMEMEDGSIGAVYSDQPWSDATVEIQRREEEPGLFGSKAFPRSTFRVRVGRLESLVTHDPAFHDPAVESMAQAVMDQWRLQP